MSVRAPGKVMVAGEYAVLHGGQALVMAVDRYAHADTAPLADVLALPPESAAALAVARDEGLLRGAHVVRVDTHELVSDARKLGLGSSAAACVAALGAALASEGVDLDAARNVIARVARRGHRRAQGGGSGVDVLASALGGLVLVRFPRGPEEEPETTRLTWPEGLHWAVLWTGVPVRTSDLIRKVNDLAARDPAQMAARMDDIGTATDALVQSFLRDDAPAAIRAVRAHYRAMLTLGRASESPIVTEGMERLAAEVEPLGAALKPSGAGGGDIALAVAHTAETLAEVVTASERHGFVRLGLGLDEYGVRVVQGVQA